MTAPVTHEEALSRDIEALRERFTQTQELYREVCALLFFRYGTTPTANKLYQLVRKGSMSAPADALSKFWGELREKSRTRIEHPELPDTLKEAAGEVIASLWVKAQADAQESLKAYQAQADEMVLQAKATVSAAEKERDVTRSESHKLREDLNQAGKQMSALREALAASEATRASLLTALEETRQENATLQRQLEHARREFAAELDKLRAAMELAEERSRATEKRMLLEIDRERTSAARLQKQFDALTVVLHGAAEEQRRELTALQQRLGDTRQKNGQLEGAVQAVTASLERARVDIEQLQLRLSESSAEAMLLRSQGEEWRRQLGEAQERAKKTRTTRSTVRKCRRL